MRNSFGQADGGGHRTAVRTVAPLPVILKTLTTTQCVALVDISDTGARVQGTNLPNEGQEVDIAIERLSAFGTVAWSVGSECCIRFDGRLTLPEIVHLRQKAGISVRNKLSVYEALEDWLHGVAR